MGDLPPDATALERARKRLSAWLRKLSQRVDPGPFHSRRCGTQFRGCAPECDLQKRWAPFDTDEA